MSKEVVMNLSQCGKQLGRSAMSIGRWLKSGFFNVPDHPHRKGCAVPITEKLFHELRLYARLRETFSHQELYYALRYLQALGHNPLSTGVFAIVPSEDGRSKKPRLLRLCSGKGEALEVTRGGQGQFLLLSFMPQGVAASDNDR